MKACSGLYVRLLGSVLPIHLTTFDLIFLNYQFTVSLDSKLNNINNIYLIHFLFIHFHTFVFQDSGITNNHIVKNLFFIILLCKYYY